MRKVINPASSVSGVITLPGDKSISHRYAMIASIAEGATRIRNYSTGADCHSTLGCVRALGIEVEGGGTEFVIHGRGLDGLRAAGRRSGRRQFRLDHPHAFRHPGGAAVSEPHLRRRVAVAPAHAAHHAAAGGNGRAASARARTSFRRSKSTARRCSPSITRCRWPARR